MHTPEVYVLFGYPGAGKSTIGQMLRDEFGLCFVEGDDYLSDSMLEILRRGDNPTDTQRRETYEGLTRKVWELSKNQPLIILSAAFTKEITRDIFLSHFPNAIFCWVESYEHDHLERLKARKNHVLSLSQALAIKNEFDPPYEARHTIYNTNMQHLREQLESIFSLPA